MFNISLWDSLCYRSATETSKNRKTNNISTAKPSAMMEFFNAIHSASFAKIDTSQCTLVMVRDSDEYGL